MVLDSCWVLWRCLHAQLHRLVADAAELHSDAAVRREAEQWLVRARRCFESQSWADRLFPGAKP